LALMMFAPMLVLTLIYFILDETDHPVAVGVVNAPAEYAERLEDYNVTARRYSEDEARRALRAGEITASLYMISGRAYIQVDGSDPGRAARALNALERAGPDPGRSRPDLRPEITYVYGAEDLSDFDYFGSVLIGFVVFFFVFLVAGISFLQERTTGTLEKLLSTPIRRWEIVCGYVLGFGAAAAAQSLLIACFCVYVLGVMLTGSFFLVLLVTLSGALTALTLGALLSTAANSEFQIIQFIPLVVIPQVFFSGLFELSPALTALGRCMPLYYVAGALTEVMLKGGGLAEIAAPLSVTMGFSLCFMALNVLLLKKHRRI
jgi:ABC-2 type transport system permease protein